MSKPAINVRFVAPGDVGMKRRKRLSREASGLRYDMSQFYGMKAVLEEAFGHPTYMKLKETGTMKDWRTATTRLLDALLLATNSTVAVADQAWRDDVADAIDRGKSAIDGSDTIADLFAGLSAVLTRIAFLQIGFMPARRARSKTVPLTAEFWTFTAHRTVQYVQSSGQKKALEAWRARRRPVAEAENVDGDA